MGKDSIGISRRTYAANALVRHLSAHWMSFSGRAFWSGSQGGANLETVGRILVSLSRSPSIVQRQRITAECVKGTPWEKMKNWLGCWGARLQNFKNLLTEWAKLTRSYWATSISDVCVTAIERMEWIENFSSQTLEASAGLRRWLENM